MWLIFVQAKQFVQSEQLNEQHLVGQWVLPSQVASVISKAHQEQPEGFPPWKKTRPSSCRQQIQ